MQILVASILIAALGCSDRKPAPPPEPVVLVGVPEITVKVPAPTPANSTVTVAAGEPLFVGIRRDHGGDQMTTIHIKADPSLSCQQLFETLDKIRQTGTADNISLLVRTPYGPGALSIPLPHAITGDGEPILVLSIARNANGEPQLFLGARSLAMSELETALRETPRRKVALDVDRATTVGTFAKVLAAATTAQLDVMLMTKPVVHEAPVSRESAIQSKP